MAIPAARELEGGREGGRDGSVTHTRYVVVHAEGRREDREGGSKERYVRQPNGQSRSARRSRRREGGREGGREAYLSPQAKPAAK